MLNDEEKETVDVPEGIKKSGLSKLFVKLHKKLTQEYEGNKTFLIHFVEGKWKDLEKQLIAEYGRLYDSTQAWIKETDANFAAFEKKYGGLYTILTRKFLVDLEGRICSSEIFVQATLDLFLEKFYKVETGLAPDGEPYKKWREALAKRHGDLSAKIHKDLTELKAKESIANEGSTQKPDSKTGGADAKTDRTSIKSSDEGV